VPLIDTAVAHAREGIHTGASARNWAAYGEHVLLPATWAPWQQTLLTDPQTSGGLLVSCAPHRVSEVLACFASAGFESAAVVGRMQAHEPAGGQGAGPRVRVV
jgi:selenide, water dikinase